VVLLLVAGSAFSISRLGTRRRREYLSDCNVAVPRRLANDPALADRLWTKSEEIVAAL
jgi:hypothetical protein